MYIIHYTDMQTGKPKTITANTRTGADNTITQLRFARKLDPRRQAEVVHVTTQSYTVTAPDVPWDDNIWTRA